MATATPAPGAIYDLLDFVFSPNWGDDTIFDFADGLEKMDMTLTGYAYGSLTIGDDGLGNAVVSDASGNSITIIGQAGNIDENDFLFDAGA